MNARQRTAVANRRLLKRLVLASMLMFGVVYAFPPFYRVFCEITGFNGAGSLQADRVVNTQADPARLVTVEFVATTNQALPWRFVPLTRSLDLHPGELAQVVYQVTNVSDQAVTGQAVPSYGPAVAARHFKKLECFCFSRQTLAPHETRELPVRFVVGRELPEDVNTITLAYTFFQTPATVKTTGRPTGGST